MTTPKRLKRRADCLVKNDKSVAESFLKGLIEQKVIPENFSGLLTPKFGKYIRIWQYDKGILVGSCLVHQNNCKHFARKVIEAELSFDWMDAIINKEEPIAEPDAVNSV